MPTIVPHKQEIPLSPEDGKKIKKQMIPILGFGVIVIIFFSFMYSFMAESLGNPFAEGEFFGYIIVAFALIFIGVVGYMFWITMFDLKGGFKYRITGVVTDKCLNVVSSNSSSHRKPTSSTKRYYYLYIDTNEYKVEYQHYTKVKVGDGIIMDMDPKSNVIFNFTITEHGTEEERKEKSASQMAFVSTEVSETPFSREDYSALYNQFIAALKSKLVWMIFPLFIIVPLVVSGMGSLLLFLFPVVLIFIFQVLGAIKLGLCYQKSRDYGNKEVITDIVRDKSTQTSNSNSNKNIIRTTNQVIQVNEQLYDILKSGDKILIFKGKYTKQALGIMTSDKKEYYLNS
jgi:hypothetical protein